MVGVWVGGRVEGVEGAGEGSVWVGLDGKRLSDGEDLRRERECENRREKVCCVSVHERERSARKGSQNLKTFKINVK